MKPALQRNVVMVVSLKNRLEMVPGAESFCAIKPMKLNSYSKKYIGCTNKYTNFELKRIKSRKSQISGKKKGGAN